MDEMKPCPFCGCSRVFVSPRTPFIGIKGCGWVAECERCWSKTAYCDSKAEAIEAWNTRAERTCRNANSDGYRFRFECCECGYATLVHNCIVRLDELPKYCPNCGAKVVSE